jgi:hypothetical protein
MTVTPSFRREKCPFSTPGAIATMLMPDDRGAKPMIGVAG